MSIVPIVETPEQEYRRVNTGLQLQTVKELAPAEDLVIHLVASVNRQGVPDAIEGHVIRVEIERVEDAVAFLEALHQWVPAWWRYRRTQEHL